ncbi:hypothetical protein A0U40_06510 [[Bacillus] sp. KCTC 13219]|nr:hypothetical protein A0U40_06510 [[Bacillus] sp. KCTC 13219]
MSEVKAEEVSVKKKPIWKRKVTWVVGVLILIVVAYNLGSSPNVPEGIGENYYSNALWAYHEINGAFKNGQFPSNEVSESLYNNVKAIDSNPSNYTNKEIYISQQLTKMLLGAGQGWQDQFYEARSNLAMVLEIKEDY